MKYGVTVENVTPNNRFILTCRNMEVILQS